MPPPTPRSCDPGMPATPPPPLLKRVPPGTWAGVPWVATAKTCLTRLFTKLDARDRVQLVILAYEAGLVSVG